MSTATINATETPITRLPIGANSPQPRRRLPDNRNLSLVYGPTYRGLPVMVQEAPLVREYLEQTYVTLHKALAEHPRVLAIRVDLRFPDTAALPPARDADTAMPRFIDAVKARIAADRARAARHNKQVHQTTVRYVWAREYGATAGKPHYHVLLLLNRDAYHTLGRYDSAQINLHRRIEAAWGSALGIGPTVAAGLVHAPRNPLYPVNRKDGTAGLVALFYRASYLCKARTKQYGDGRHAFGCSRY